MYQSSNVSIRYKSIDKTLFPKYNKNNIVWYTIEWHDFYDLKETENVSILSISIWHIFVRAILLNGNKIYFFNASNA